MGFFIFYQSCRQKSSNTVSLSVFDTFHAVKDEDKLDLMELHGTIPFITGLQYSTSLHH